MDKKLCERTAFITYEKLFEFNVMPYSLTNAPAPFQRPMDIALAGLKWQCCFVYIDDITVYSSTFEWHLKDLKKVLEAFRTTNLTVKAFKCHFCRRETKHLGHIITQNGIESDTDLVKSVINFPQLTKIKEVQLLLGLTGYYSRSVKSHARIAELLIKQLCYSSNSNYQLSWTSIRNSK